MEVENVRKQIKNELDPNRKPMRKVMWQDVCEDDAPKATNKAP